MADKKVALQSSFTNYEPLDNHQILLKLGEGKRNMKFIHLIELSQGFFSHEREKKFDVSFDPYVLFNLEENEISICGCSNDGGCPVPDVKPISDDRKIICFKAPDIIPGRSMGVKIDCLHRAIQQKFGARKESVRLWFGPPNVVAQLMG